PATLISRVLQVLRDHFDYVIVDTPPAFDDHVLTAFDLSDVVALIATLDIPALKNLKLTLETMDLLNYPRDRWRVVLNRADSKVGLAIGEVEKSPRPHAGPAGSFGGAERRLRPGPACPDAPAAEQRPVRRAQAPGPPGAARHARPEALRRATHAVGDGAEGPPDPPGGAGDPGDAA